MPYDDAPPDGADAGGSFDPATEFGSDPSRQRTALFILSFFAAGLIVGIPLLIWAIGSASPDTKTPAQTLQRKDRESLQARVPIVADDDAAVEPARIRKERDRARDQPLEEVDDIVPIPKVAPKRSKRAAAPEPEKAPATEPIAPEKKADEKPPKAKEPEIPAEVKTRIEKLGKGNTAERNKAADELGKMGDQARPAARALCSAATDQRVRVATVNALEKIEPELAKHVTTLLVDRDSFAIATAARELGELGPAASPTIPVLIWHVKFISRDSPSPCIQALAQVGPTDEEEVLFLIRCARFPPRLGARYDPRAEALATLGKLTKNTGKLREKIVAALVRSLDEWEGRLRNPAFAFNNPLLTVIEAVAEYGPDAQKAIPILNRLKLDMSMRVREAVSKALARIER